MTAMTLGDTLEMLAECFETDAASLTADTLRDDLPGWDSMGALSLMAELDARFDLELTADESRQMQRISDVLDYLRARDLLAE